MEIIFIKSFILKVFRLDLNYIFFSKFSNNKKNLVRALEKNKKKSFRNSPGLTELVFTVVEQKSVMFLPVNLDLKREEDYDDP